jgi:transcriptional regulator with XRE-family HTH domain
MELKLNQKQAADLLGVNPSTVLNWETGRTSPPVRSMAIILSFLGIPSEP